MNHNNYNRIKYNSLRLAVFPKKIKALKFNPIGTGRAFMLRRNAFMFEKM